jgi:hypothetical protein
MSFSDHLEQLSQHSIWLGEETKQAIKLLQKGRTRAIRLAARQRLGELKARNLQALKEVDRVLDIIEGD